MVNASCKRCVIRSDVVWDTSRCFTTSSMIVVEVIGSSPAVGESYKIRSGFERHPPPHPAAQLRRKFLDRFLEFHEPQRLDHAFMRLHLGKAFLVQPIAHVVFYVERIEQGAFLEHHPHMRSHRIHLRLAHGAQRPSEDINPPRIGWDQPVRQLHQRTFSTAGRPQDHPLLPAFYAKAHVPQHMVLLKLHRHVAELDNRRRLRAQAYAFAVRRVARIVVSLAHGHSVTAQRCRSWPASPGSRTG
jgi:hypothetical protein